MKAAFLTIKMWVGLNTVGQPNSIPDYKNKFGHHPRLQIKWEGKEPLRTKYLMSYHKF